MSTPSPAMFARRKPAHYEEVDSGRPSTVFYSTATDGSRSGSLLEASAQAASAAYPSFQELKFWWECFRKVQFESLSAARAHNREYPEAGTSPYLCSWGDHSHWHLGREAGEGPRAKNSTSPSQLRKQWRKREVRPPRALLTEACQKAQARLPFERERDAW